MYEKFFKKRLITVPVSHFYHTVISPTSALTMSSWAVLTQRRKANCLNRNSYKKMGKKITLEGFFSLFPSHSCNHFAFSLSLFTRSSIGRKIHTYDILKKKSTMMTNIGMKYKLHQVLSFWPLPPPKPLYSLMFQSRSAADSSCLVHRSVSFVQYFGFWKRNWWKVEWKLGHHDLWNAHVEIQHQALALSWTTPHSFLSAAPLLLWSFQFSLCDPTLSVTGTSAVLFKSNLNVLASSFFRSVPLLFHLSCYNKSLVFHHWFLVSHLFWLKLNNGQCSD